MSLNFLKLGRAVTFMKDLANVVLLIFLPKTLVWSHVPESLNFAELVVNELMKIMYKKSYRYSFSYPTCITA